MAVWNVMRDLADGPAFETVGCVELLVGQALDGGAQVGWGLCDVGQILLLLLGGGWAFVVEFSDWIARVGHGHPPSGNHRATGTILATTTPSAFARSTPFPPASHFDSPCPKICASKVVLG